MLHARDADLRRCRALLGGSRRSVPAGTAGAPDLGELMGRIGTNQSEAVIHADYVRRLEAVKASINNYRGFLSQHGGDPEVNAILGRTSEFGDAQPIDTK